MKIIKEYVETRGFENTPNYRCAVYADTYIDTLSHILMLADIARRHEVLFDHNIDIKHYGGDRYRGIKAVEFATDFEPKESDGWVKVRSLNPTL